MSARQAVSGHHNLRNKIIAIAVGTGITILTVWAGWRGWFLPYELKSYDARMVWLSKIPASASIVHIDIDDGSLATVGRWPWPRERLAELIETLQQAGARNIALDILLRQEDPGGDAGLAEAMKTAGHVLIPTHFQLPQEDKEQESWSASLEELFQKNPFELDGEPLSPATAGAKLGVDSAALGDHFYSRQQEFVDNQVLKSLEQGKINSQLELLAHYGLLGDGEGTPEYTVIRRAFRRAESILESSRFATVGRQALAPQVFSPGHIDPPIPELGRAAGGIAFITGIPDVDGVFRKVPLLARRGNYVYRQYSFFLACELLGIKDQNIVYDRQGYLLLGRSNRQEEAGRIPVDQAGWMLINFRPGFNGRWWDSGFVHLPAGQILEIPQIRERMANNASKRQKAVRETIRNTRPAEELTEFDRLNQAIAELEDKLDKNPTVEQAELLRVELGRVEQARSSIEKEAIEQIIFQYQSLPVQPPSDPEQLQLYHNTLLFYQDLVVTDYQAENQKLAKLLDERLAGLKDRVGGRVCLVGSTASGGLGEAPDYVSCPVFPRAPGIVVHANILNTILQGQFLTPIAGWQSLLLAAGCGALATVLSGLLKPLQSVGLVVVVMGGYLLTNFAAFSGGVVLPLVLPVTVILLSFAGVMAYRQLFEAKEKRRMVTALGQFTSPEVARRILAQPDLLCLSGEMREVSCFFSDLQGFTPLSEKLGPEKTVSLLNRYLDRMTEVLFQHEATVNKFAGDGIFAFFGAPEPQPDHARRACLAAVDSQVALARLCAELAEEGGGDLRMRVGINTGPAVVGNCGSSRKFDYTALGDSVNLASRLEPSNKFFGSLILVSKQTFEQAQLPDNILSRPLGAIVAVGRSEITEVVELLGPEDDQPGRVDAVKKFSAGLEAYRQRQLKEALEIFEACLKLWPEDGPARVYAGLCRKALQEPQKGPWDPTVRMTAK